MKIKLLGIVLAIVLLAVAVAGAKNKNDSYFLLEEWVKEWKRRQQFANTAAVDYAATEVIVLAFTIVVLLLH